MSRRKPAAPRRPPEGKPPGAIAVTVRSAGGESVHRYEADCDRIAADESGAVYVLSLVAPANVARAIRAAFNGQARSRTKIEAQGLEFSDGEQSRHYGYSTPLRPHAGGYRMHAHRLGYDWVHALLIARDPTLLPCVSETALWLALNRPRFTTPILPGWMPFLVRELQKAGGLAYLFGQNCRAGLLTATTDDLDAAVVAGCRTGAFLGDFYDLPPLAAGEAG
jgi:hypothetical protein